MILKNYLNPILKLFTFMHLTELMDVNCLVLDWNAEGLNQQNLLCVASTSTTPYALFTRCCAFHFKPY